PFATTPSCDIHRTASSQRLKSQYAFVRLTKSTRPVERVPGSKANRTRRAWRGRDRGDACARGEPRRGASQWSLPLNWKLRFGTVKCRFSTHVLTPRSALYTRVVAVRDSRGEGGVSNCVTANE
ncbi:hypothetical protein WH47_03155, partial [Habropoda laboriosa]